VELIANKNASQWRKPINESDIPHNFFNIFAAITSTSVSMIFPWWVCEQIITKILSILADDKF